MRWIGVVIAAATTVLIALVALGSIPSACGCSTSPPLPTSPVDGVVISVDAVSLTDVRGFRLRTSADETITFKLGDLENATEFSPSHLSEHLATSAPIRVWFQLVNGDRVVYRLEDASPPRAT